MKKIFLSYKFTKKTKIIFFSHRESLYQSSLRAQLMIIFCFIDNNFIYIHDHLLSTFHKDSPLKLTCASLNLGEQILTSGIWNKAKHDQMVS